MAVFERSGIGGFMLVVRCVEKHKPLPITVSHPAPVNAPHTKCASQPKVEMLSHKLREGRGGCVSKPGTRIS